MRTPLVAGNWKMTSSYEGGLALAAALAAGVGGSRHQGVEVLVCPPFPLLPALLDVLRGSGIAVGAQDAHWESDGAFTGAVSPAMLAELGCTHLLCGHSERRQHFGDGDDEVASKVGAALATGMIPVLCVGETAAERESGSGEAVVLEQLARGIAPVAMRARAREAAEVVIAYEPVWAIGTGLAATPEQATRMHRAIRRSLRDLLPGDQGERTRILYGGSVTAANASELLGSKGAAEIDGVLVGGASRKSDIFLEIVATAAT